MNDARRVDWCELAPLALLTFLWLAATAWARPLMLPDEGRYAGVAWEMLRSGDWLTPRSTACRSSTNRRCSTGSPPARFRCSA